VCIIEHRILYWELGAHDEPLFIQNGFGNAMIVVSRNTGPGVSPAKGPEQRVRRGPPCFCLTWSMYRNLENMLIPETNKLIINIAVLATLD